MFGSRRKIAAFFALSLATTAAHAASGDDSPEESPIWVGIGGGGGGARFEGELKGVFDASLEVGFPMGESWAVDVRLLLHGTPDVGFGVIGGLLELRKLIAPAKRLSPFLYGGAGFAFGGRGEQFLTPLGRLGLGARYRLSSWLYAAPEAFVSANTAALSAGGALGLGLLF